MHRDEPPRAPGRPRSQHCRLATLEAAADLLEELPYTEVTIEGIAERAGVSKQTIYKWWRSRAVLCMEAYAERASHQFGDPPPGPVRDQLTAILTDTCRVLRTGNNARIIAGFIGEAQSDPELAAEFRDVFITSRRRAVTATLTHGIESGALRPDLDVLLTIELLYGPLWYRLLLRHAPLDDAFAKTVVDHLWSSLEKR
ncbi:Transcriptional regulator, TetR family protein [Minicystis rosea]|nr:Transcriptional regulator, TetR family protein [Minicystis rosea]